MTRSQSVLGVATALALATSFTSSVVLALPQEPGGDTQEPNDVPEPDAPAPASPAPAAPVVVSTTTSPAASTRPAQYAAAPPTAARLPYREGRPTPPGYAVDTVPRAGLIVGGATMAGVLHVVSMISAVALDAEADETLVDEQGGVRSDPEFDNRYTPLFIPLVGPFITVKTAEAHGTGMALLVMNGVAQVTGLSLVISGLAAPKKVLVREEPSFAIAPLVTEGGGGVALEGKF
jgi:hypothetical protein